jgi:hypothetical protein
MLSWMDPYLDHVKLLSPPFPLAPPLVNDTNASSPLAVAPCFIMFDTRFYEFSVVSVTRDIKTNQIILCKSLRTREGCITESS